MVVIKIKIMNKLVEIWTEAETFVDKLMVILIYGLTALAVTGFGKILFELFTNPSQFNNTTYGIFDTLG